MVHEDVSKNRKLAIDRCYLTEGTLEGCAETLEGCRRVKFADLELRLSGDEFALEVCDDEGI